jgi:hypothetical protein
MFIDTKRQIDKEVNVSINIRVIVAIAGICLIDLCYIYL